MSNEFGLHFKYRDFTRKNGENDLHLYFQDDISDINEIKQVLEQYKDLINFETFDGKTPLHYFCQNSCINSDILKLFYDFHADFTKLTCEGRAALHFLCQNKNISKEILKQYFIINEIDENGTQNDNKKYIGFNTRDYYGITPFLMLCSNTSLNPNVLNFAIEKGANCLKASIFSENALHFLFLNPNPSIELAKILIQNGLDINQKNDNGETPFHYACRFQTTNKETITELIKNGANIKSKNAERENIFHYACKYCNVDVIIYLFQQYPHSFPKTKTNENYFHFLCQNQMFSDELLSFLNIKQCDINLQNNDELNTPLHYLCANTKLDDYGLIDLFVKNGADINICNKNKETPLFLLFKNDGFQSYLSEKYNIKQILQYNVDFSQKNYSNESLLQIAFTFFPSNVLYQLIKTKTLEFDEVICYSILHNKNFIDASIFSSFFKKCSKKVDEKYLFYASENKNINIDVIKILMDNCNDIKIADECGVTPLHVACRTGNIKLVKFFIEYGSDPLFKTKENETILHFACQNDSIEIELLEYILSLGVNINDTTNSKKSAFHFACEHLSDAYKQLEFLYEKGADIYQYNNRHQRCLDFALLNPHSSIDLFNFLLQHNICDLDISAKSAFYSFISTHSIYEIDFFISHFKIPEKIFVNIFYAVLDDEFLHAEKFNYFVKKYNKYIKEKQSIMGKIKEPSPLFYSIKRNFIISSLILINHGSILDEIDNYGSTPLIEATKANQKIIVYQLIKKGCKIDTENKNGETPLLAAIKNQNIPLVKLLLSHIDQYYLEKPNSNGIIPLFYAVKENSLKIIKILIRKGCNIFRLDKDKNNLLHYASYHTNNKKILQCLISLHININQRNLMKYTPLHIACEKGNLNYIEIFIKHGASISLTANKASNLMDLSLIALSVMSNSINSLKVIQYLENKGANLYQKASNNVNILHLYCKYSKQIDVLNYILSHNIDFNEKTAKDKTALLIACKYGDIETIQILLNNGLDVNSTDNLNRTPLIISCERNDATIVKMLLEYKPNINVMSLSKETNLFDKSALHIACENGCYEIVKLLIDNGAAVDLLNSKSETPLHFAAKSFNSEIVQILLEHHVSINAITRDLKTPLHYACEIFPFEGDLDQNLNFYKILIDNGANLLLRDFKGNSPLIYLVDRNTEVIFKKQEIISYFINKGSDINSANNKNKTLLYYLIKRNDLMSAKYLLSQSANPNIMPIKNNTFLTSLFHLLLKNFTKFNDDLTIDSIYQKMASKSILDNFISNHSLINISDAKGRTPLHIACKYCNEEIIENLIANGADVNAKTAQKENTIHFYFQNKVVSHYVWNIKSLYDPITLNEPNLFGQSPIHIALQIGTINLIERLFQKPIDYNAKDNLNFSCFHYFLKRNYKENSLYKTNPNSSNQKIDTEDIDTKLFTILNFLFEKNIDVNCRTINKETPLHFACKYNPQFIDKFLENGADVNVHDNEYNSPLHNACCCKDITPEIILKLIENGSQINEYNKKGKTPLLLACENYLQEVAIVLIKKGADVNVVDTLGNYKTPLHYACENNSLNLVQLLLQYGANVNYLTPSLSCLSNKSYNETALHIACESLNDNSKEIIKTLLHYGANVDAIRGDGKKPLDLLYENDSFDIIPTVIKYGTSRTSNNDSLLEVFIKNSDIKSVRALLKKNEDPNRAFDSILPLHFACYYNLKQIVQYLIKYGAKINLINEQYESSTNINSLKPTALMISCFHGNNALTKYLLKHNADPNIIFNNESALKCACSSKSHKCVKYLLEYGANPNEIIENVSILSFACTINSERIVQLFIEKGADISLNHQHFIDNTKTFQDDYVSVIHYACYSGSIDIVKALIEKGANLYSLTYNEYLPLHYACLSPHDPLELVQFMHEEKMISLNDQTFNRKTALHIAIQFQNVSVSKYIARNIYNKHMIYKDIIETMDDLSIKLFLDIIPTEELQWIFEYSFKFIRDESKHFILKQLIKKENIQFDVYSKEGDCFIHLLVKEKSFDLLKEILEQKSINFYIKNKNGKTILDIANEMKWEEGITLISQYLQ